MMHYHVRDSDLLQPPTRAPLARPGLRPDRCRSDFGAGFLRSPSLEGGLEELCESAATCRSNSAIRSACAAIVAACSAIVAACAETFNSTTSAAKSSYEGCGG
jgi:hypothetical protein